MKMSSNTITLTAMIVGTLLSCAPATIAAQQQAEPSVGLIEPATSFNEAIAKSRGQLHLLLQRGVPGVSAAVGVDGKIVWSEGVGMSDIELQVPVSPQTRFRVGSVAKAMTSIAMIQLVNSGVLDLDAPIQTYLPDYPVKEKGDISTRLLASHRAGMRHYLDDDSDIFVTKHYDDVLDALDIFANDPLIGVPGQQYSYSSHGYNLLSAVMQEASGVEFLSLMRQSVFAPLRLLDTVADHTDYLISNRAAVYERDEQGVLLNAPYVDNSYKWAGGGFLSTPTDLVQFGFGVFEGDLISEESRRMLTTPPRMANGEQADQAYGLGWQLFDDGWVGHTGGSIGGTTLFMIHPELRVSYAVVCNMSNCLAENTDVLLIGGYFADTLGRK